MVSERIIEEQAALRRVATLVARAATPEEAFAGVAAEVGQLLGADLTILGRYDPGGTVTAVGAWSGTGGPVSVPHMSARLGGRNTPTLVFRTRRAARVDDYADASGPPADAGHGWGFRSAVGAPISIEGRLWGVMTVASTHARPLPADTESRLSGFTELVATAIANAQARVELRGFAEEQAALRRVATLVARATRPEEVFASVAAEVGRLLAADFTILSRRESDGAHVSVAAWSSTGDAVPFPIGTRVGRGARNVMSLVVQTGRPARIKHHAETSGPVADDWGPRSAVGAPINVEGGLWGVMAVAAGHEQSLPADTEMRLAGFSGLVATAIADAQARVELRGFAEEQAALRRVATLVARAAPPEDVFAAVTAEIGRVLRGDVIVLNRYDPDDTETVLGAWSSTGIAPVAVGTRVRLGGRNVSSLVFGSGRPVRIDDYANVSGAVGDVAREVGVRASVGVPISVAGRLWGVVLVATRSDPLPADTEARLTGFTELVATALANAEARDALAASRARIVAAADTTRRRSERDLHDGAQQRLVSLGLHLRSKVRSMVPPGADELTALLDGVVAELGGVLDELREIARGLHPAALAQGGLRPALKALGRRSAVPARLDVRVDGRLPRQIELAAYYIVAEALTNVAKHAHASVIDVEVAADDSRLWVGVRDDGCGGADPTSGSGLVGLTDRVEALGGRISLHSPCGAGTSVQVELPLGGGHPASP